MIFLNQVEYELSRLKKKHSTNSGTNGGNNTSSFKEKKESGKNQNYKFLKMGITKSLIAVILVLVACIYANFGSDFKSSLKKEMFEKNLSFVSIKELYEKYFGSVLPIEKIPNSSLVSQEKTTINNVEKYLDGYKLGMKKGSVVQSLVSGIVVYIGPKEGYDQVVIVQGIDGVDIWYGNLSNTNLTLYDYIEVQTILGEAKDDFIYMLINQDGSYLDYDTYTKTI